MALKETPVEIERKVASSTECGGCFLDTETTADAVGACAMVESLEVQYSPIVAGTIADIISSQVPLTMSMYSRTHAEKYSTVSGSALIQRFAKATSIIKKSPALRRLIDHAQDGRGGIIYRADKSLIPELCPEIINEQSGKARKPKRRVNKEANPTFSPALAEMMYDFMRTGNLDEEALFNLTKVIDQQSQILSMQKAMTRSIRSDAYFDSLEMQARFKKVSGLAYTGNILGLIDAKVLESLRGRVQSATENEPETTLLDSAMLEKANCLGTNSEFFFPGRGEGSRKQREICECCAVKIECQDDGLVSGQKFGIWGGLSERDRRQIRRQRSKARKIAQSEDAIEA